VPRRIDCEKMGRDERVIVCPREGAAQTAVMSSKKLESGHRTEIRKVTKVGFRSNLLYRGGFKRK